MRFSCLAIGSAIVLMLGFSVGIAQPPAGKFVGIKRVTKTEEKKPTDDKLPMTGLSPAKIIPNLCLVKYRVSLFIHKWF